MKLSHAMLVMVIAIVVCLSTMALADDYDIQDFILPSLSNGSDFVTSVGFTGAEQSVKYQFKTRQGLTTGSGSNFRATLPEGYAIASGIALGCSISDSTRPSGVAGVASTTASINGALSVSCAIVAGTSLTFGPTQIYFVSFSGFKFTAPAKTYSCSSSLVSPSAASSSGGIFDIIDKLLDLNTGSDSQVVAGNAEACCANVGLYYYGTANSVQSYQYASQCALPKDKGSSSGILKLFDFSIAAENNNIAATVTTLSASFKTSVDLKASNRTGIGGDVVPAYLWYYLPHYRASKTVITESSGNSDPWNAAKLGISCDIFVNDKKRAPFSTSSSPAVLVRPIDDADQSAGIIVQCSLGAAISTGSIVKATIAGVISPAASYYGDICTAYGKTSSNSACCGDAHVSYRYGNSVNDNSIYESTDASTCPVFFKDNTALQFSLSAVIATSISFSPTQVTPHTPVNNAQYRFTPTLVIAAGSSITLKLPGFQLSASDQALLVLGREVRGSLRFVVDGSSTPTTTDAIIVSVNECLRFSAVLPFALSANVQVSVFFQAVIPTPSLPSYSQCASSSLSGTVTSDALCCQEFSIEIIIGGKRFVIFPSTCAALPEDAVTSCEIAFGFTKCCTIRTIRAQLTTITLEKCYLYSCTGSNFDTSQCCTHNLYRSNARCCNNAYFCPNHCCGQIDIPIPGFTPYFNNERCCVDSVLDELPQLEKICHCWELDVAGEFEELLEEGCCELTANTVAGNSTAPTTTLTPYCQCEELFTLLNPPNSTAVYTPAQRNSIILNYTIHHPHFDIDKCCTLSIPLFTNDQYCQCLEDAQTPDSFNTDICCAYNAWKDDLICELECTPTPCCDEGNCCITDRLSVNISGVQSKEATLIKVLHDPTPCCSSCACGGTSLTSSSSATVTP